MRLPAVESVSVHWPVATATEQLFTPSLTVTLPVGAVGVLPVLDDTLKLTVNDCPLTVAGARPATPVTAEQLRSLAKPPDKK